jgi:predicted ATPase/DNA-binding CsgD family transcriptional regulator
VETSLTTLIGRERDVARVADFVRDPDIPLLTISGPGGVGKTRLAHAAAAEIAEDFVDGIVIVSLDPIADPDLVLPTIARALGLRETQDEPLEALKEQLQDRRLLLVLDTFEHVVDSAPALVDLLAACPELKLVVTSRTRLRVSGEHEFVLAPLAEGAAVALFRERARAAEPNLEFGEVEMSVVAEICAQLDGLPLAIELAAARVKVLAPDAILARLEYRLELLTAGPRDRPDRQQTLRSTIDWSFELLDEAEQELFRRLSVFVGGCALDAVESVGGANLDTLGSLVDKSLVRSEQGRYRMLDTVRAYALEQLEASGEQNEVQFAHASYFAALAEAAEPMLVGPVQAAWRERLESEQGNFRAALRYMLDHAHSDDAVRLAAYLWGFWFEHGHLSEGRGWLDEVLASSRASSTARARALAGAGILAHYQGDYSRAQELCEESLTVSRALEDRQAIAGALTGLALVARTRGDCLDADRLFHDVLLIYEELGDRARVARTLNRQGIVAWFLEEYERTRTLLEQSAEIFREVGDTAGVALARLDLAMVAVSRGDAATLHHLPDESLAVFRQLGDRRNVAKALWALGDLACELGDHGAASAYLEESLTLFLEVGDRWFVAAIVLERAADTALGAGDAERAARLFGAAAWQLEQIGVPLPGCFGARHERHLAEVKAKLGADRFEAAWLEGRGIPLGATVELVRDGAPAAPAGDRAEGLTGRELDILALVADGLTDAQVAERLVVSLRTVHAHLRSIYRKLDVHSRSAATRYALEHGLAGSPA